MQYDPGLCAGHTETIFIDGDIHNVVNTPSLPRRGYCYEDEIEYMYPNHPKICFDWDAPLARYIESGKLIVPEKLQSYFLKL